MCKLVIGVRRRWVGRGIREQLARAFPPLLGSLTKTTISERITMKVGRLLVLASILAPLTTQAQDSRAPIEPIPQIVVSGRGEVKVSPDRATIQISVQTRAATAAAAATENATKTQAVLAALRGLGLGNDQLSTINCNRCCRVARREHDYVPRFLRLQYGGSSSYSDRVSNREGTSRCGGSCSGSEGYAGDIARDQHRFILASSAADDDGEAGDGSAGRHSDPAGSGNAYRRGKYPVEIHPGSVAPISTWKHYRFLFHVETLFMRG